MNMLAFDRAVWKLHRKLFHRFMKFSRFIVLATEDLPEYQSPAPVTHFIDITQDNVVESTTICLLSSDSEGDNGIETADEWYIYCMTIYTYLSICIICVGIVSNYIMLTVI